MNGHARPTGPLACVVGARPNYLKMAPLLRAFSARIDLPPDIEPLYNEALLSVLRAEAAKIHLICDPRGPGGYINLNSVEGQEYYRKDDCSQPEESSPAQCPPKSRGSSRRRERRR